MIGFLGNATSETETAGSVRFRVRISNRLTFSGMEFDHVKSESNLLERVISLSGGNATLEKYLCQQWRAERECGSIQDVLFRDRA